MNETSFSAKVVENATLMTREQAWDTLNAVCSAITEPGWLEHQLEHSPLAGKVKAAKLSMFNALVTGTSICQGITDQAADQMSKGIHELQMSYMSYIQLMLDQASLAIQSLSLEELITEHHLHEGEVDFDTMPIGDNARASIKAQYDILNKNTPGGKTLIAKPCEQVACMFGVAAGMLGSVDKLAEMQAEIIESLPPEYRSNPIVVLAAQATGVLSQAFQQRAVRDDFVTASIASISEIYLTFERAATLAFVPMWDDKATDVFGHILDAADAAVTRTVTGEQADQPGAPLSEREQFSREAERGAEDFIQKAESTSLKPAQAPLEADAPENMKATSTLFPGTRSIN